MIAIICCILIPIGIGIVWGMDTIFSHDMKLEHYWREHETELDLQFRNPVGV